MKILHVTKKFRSAIGGDSLVVANLERCQKANGHDVLVLTTNCDVIDDAPNVYKFGLKDTPAGLDALSLKRLLSMPSLVMQLRKILKAEKPDVIHTHSPDLGFVVSKIAKRHGVPVVHTCHGVTFPDPMYPQAKRSLELYLLRHANYQHITVLSPSLVDTFAEQGMGNAVFVPNGVDVEFWQPNAKTKKNKTFTFDTVGRLEDQKGFGFLVEACQTLHKRGHDFRVVIISTGSKYNELVAKAKELGVSERIEFVGNKTPAEIRALHQKANAYVSSSIWEGFPLTILEAWAMELPVVTTQVGSIGEISPVGASFLIPAKDTAALAGAMEEVMLLHGDAKGRARLAHMTKTNRAACEQTYNWPAIATKLEGLYEK